MPRYGFFFDASTCLGCFSCQFACAEEHSLAKDTWLRCVDLVEGQNKKNCAAFSGSCNHCLEPACAQACQVGALERNNQQGVVLHKSSDCIGCTFCLWTCPYGAISLNPKNGKAQKCDSCLKRREQGLPPACVAACPTESLGFGEVDDLQLSDKFLFLPSPEVTNPSLRIVNSQKW